MTEFQELQAQLFCQALHIFESVQRLSSNMLAFDDRYVIFTKKKKLCLSKIQMCANDSVISDARIGTTALWHRGTFKSMNKALEAMHHDCIQGEILQWTKCYSDEYFTALEHKSIAS